jgi:AcrR family transcriptional regulator
MRRTKQEAEETRKNLLATALEIFSEKGYDAANLGDIAERANVTRGAIYWHFKNKAHLYNTLITEVVVGRSDAVVQDAVGAGGNLADALREIMTRQLEYLEVDPEYRAVMALMLFKSGVHSELHPAVQTLMHRSQTAVNQMARLMRQGSDAGHLRGDIDPVDAARAFVAYQQGLALMWLRDPVLFSIRGQASALADVFIGGIAAG